MTKHTGIVASAVLRRHIPPARPMPVIVPRRRNPGWVPAKTVGSFVPALTRKAFEKYGFSTAALITDWAEIVGARFAAYTAPQRLKWPRLKGEADAGDAAGAGRPGATLVLKVDPARALDAEYAAAAIVDRINQYFGYRAVAELRLIQAPIETTAGPASPTGRRPVTPPLPVPSDCGHSGLEAALARLGASIAARRA